MRKAKKGDTVIVHYTGTLDDGTCFDTSEGADPLKFEIGEGTLLQLFEDSMLGMSDGEEKTIRIPAEEAYGAYNKDLLIAFQREQIPPNIEPRIGMELQIDEADGWNASVKVVEMNDTMVWVDANHPLAGKDLTFLLKLIQIV